MKMLLPLLALVLMECSSSPPVKQTASDTKASVTAAFYSESHLVFEGRTPESFVDEGEELAVASAGKHSAGCGTQTYGGGGNLIDAAVAVAFCMAVERPHSLGIGGGGFFLIHQKDKTPQNVFVDFRETAPRNARRDMYLDRNGKPIADASTIGGLAVATPGFVAGLFEIHKRWGLLPWKKVLQPSFELAKRGFVIPRHLAHIIHENRETFLKDPYLAKIFSKDGVVLQMGDLLVQEDLSKTIELLARQGKFPFYNGPIAKAMAQFLKEKKGILDAQDLSNYQVKFRKPIIGNFRGYRFVSAPPPSAGGILLAQMFSVLNTFDLNKLFLQEPAEYYHLLSEVMKRGYADRSEYIGDPDFYKKDVGFLVSPSRIGQIKNALNRERATPSREIAPEKISAEDRGTGHMSLMDKEGNAVAGTLTINDSFGAQIAIPEYGFFLNNEMDDFSIKPGEPNIYGLTGNEANSIAPKKRPASSMSPTIFVDSTGPILAIGGAGGSRIITSVFETIVNDLVLYPWDLRKAVFAPRAHHQWLPDKFDLEESIPSEVREVLRKKGHAIDKWPFKSNVEAVHVTPERRFVATADPRGDGGALAK